ncbi:hypothetical protein V8C86DRAFT_2757592, partial [Haematococcus lacustris]
MEQSASVLALQLQLLLSAPGALQSRTCSVTSVQLKKCGWAVRSAQQARDSPRLAACAAVEAVDKVASGQQHPRVTVV